MGTPTASDILRLSALLKRACDIYGRQHTEDLVHAYAEALDGTPVERMEQAAAAHFRTSRFFPAPCDLLLVGGEPQLRIEAGEDWSLLKKGKDARNDVKLSSGALNLVGGYSMIRDLLVTDEPHRRREFIEAYLALAREAEIDKAVAQLSANKMALPS